MLGSEHRVLPYEQFVSTHGGFSADIPTGNGWTGPQETVEGDGQIYRTTFTGPNGLSLLIDFTPDIKPKFNGPYESKQTVPQPAFGSATEIVFTGGAFPQCDLGCVDYLIPDGDGGGYAVLVGGADTATLRELAQPIVESLSYYDV